MLRLCALTRVFIPASGLALPALVATALWARRGIRAITLPNWWVWPTAIRPPRRQKGKVCSRMGP